jgi:ribosomal protein L11 methyltransferase
VVWLQLSVTTAREQAEAVGDTLEELGALSVTMTGNSDEELLEPLPGVQPLWQEVRLQALVSADVDLEAVRAALSTADAELVDVEFVDDDDWQERWRAHAVRACFGGRLWLVPRDEAAAAPAPEPGRRAVLRLDPGLAFGSGSHPTTRLCLEGLAALPLEGRRVLDYGCGSGILALAACLLGAASVTAVDHDPQALLATRENAAYNSIEADRLSVRRPEDVLRADPPLPPFDVVVANILANPLVELAPALTALTAPGGLLMLSGLLVEQERAIREAYPDVVFDAAVREAEWIRLDGWRSGRR